MQQWDAGSRNFQHGFWNWCPSPSVRLWLYLLADHGMTGKPKGAQMPRHQEIRIWLLKCGPCFCYKIMVRIQDILRDLGNRRQSPFHTADYIFFFGGGGSWLDFCSLQVKSAVCQLWPSVVLHEYTGGWTTQALTKAPWLFETYTTWFW